MKNAQMGKVMNLLIIFATLFILIRFIGVPLLFAGERGDIEICRLTVLASSKSGDIIEIKCPMKEVEIKKTKEADIKEQLADEMAECWYKMGEAKISPFNRDLFKEKRVCVLCSEIEFDKEVQKKSPNINDFLVYLADTDMPKTDISYFTYFTDTTIENKEELKGKILDRIDTEKKYNLVYVLDKEKKFTTIIPTVAIGTGALILVFTPVPGSRILAGALLLSIKAATVYGTYKGYQLGQKLEKDYITIALIPQSESLGKEGMNCTHLFQ